jgi:hypothetical protein
MTDPGSARDVNEAAWRFAETLANSYGLVYEQAEGSTEAVAFPHRGLRPDERRGDPLEAGGPSVEELQLVRDHEELHEGRTTLLEQMDRKIRASS